jgi:hypothetical protein
MFKWHKQSRNHTDAGGSMNQLHQLLNKFYTDKIIGNQDACVEYANISMITLSPCKAAGLTENKECITM